MTEKTFNDAPTEKCYKCGKIADRLVAVIPWVWLCDNCRKDFVKLIENWLK